MIAAPIRVASTTALKCFMTYPIFNLAQVARWPLYPQLIECTTYDPTAYIHLEKATIQAAGGVMPDTAKYRAEIIEYLEKALLLSEQASEPIVGYLIERALDEARASQVKGMPKPKSS